MLPCFDGRRHADAICERLLRAALPALRAMIFAAMLLLDGASAARAASAYAPRGGAHEGAARHEDIAIRRCHATMLLRRHMLSCGYAQRWRAMPARVMRHAAAMRYYCGARDCARAVITRASAAARAVIADMAYAQRYAHARYHDDYYAAMRYDDAA